MDSYVHEERTEDTEWGDEFEEKHRLYKSENSIAGRIVNQLL
jgi:hypothetical protein